MSSRHVLVLTAGVVVAIITPVPFVLDPAVKTRVFGAFDRLAADGAAVLFSSLGIKGVQRYADRIGLLADGELHETSYHVSGKY